MGSTVLQAASERVLDWAGVSELAGEPWFVDAIDHSDSCLTVRGWAFPASSWGIPHRPTFRWNGKPFDSCRTFVRRDDVAAKFPRRRFAALSGFECTVAGIEGGWFTDGFLRLDSLTFADSLPQGMLRTWCLPDPTLERPLPSADQRFRVIGNRDEFGFRLSGATDAYRLSCAIANVTGRPIASFNRTLDWGCGCGRVARYMAIQLDDRLFGCDIDAENARWCNSHLPGDFVSVDPLPPLPFPDAAFDLVYGVSVFTHLGKERQDLWLAELRRVTMKNGIVAVTVHGQTAIDYAGLQRSERSSLEAAVKRDGLFIASSNDQLDGAVSHETEYLNVFHDRHYVNSHWSKWFEVLAIVPGYIFTHDLVILKAG